MYRGKLEVITRLVSRIRVTTQLNIVVVDCCYKVLLLAKGHYQL
jgi:hypothetical protein